MSLVKDYFTIPNIITIGRIATIPFFGYYIFIGEMATASILFLFMAISDFMDGFIARKFNQITKLGKFLDPLADKVVIMTTIFVAGLFQVTYSIPFYFAVVILIKELYLVVGIVVIYLFRKRFIVETLFIGKVTMFMEYLTVVMYMLSYFFPFLGIVLHYLYIITTFFAFLSIVFYTVKN
ncbi:CDP-alcohol phosphatidyltransferase family protein [Calditerrivibrio nitroreducens]|uniref:CDP-diacylglycerol--glycerol-3-phosphate 3-phosphatidyltransferase n=1 Tax=Calditerrivibrio nitroreducens (strain DSM 19672 / NBRC 101217 / Yu37-1) TaxID=768670 RepID=E4TIH5_CALNY|nr:CDP-alcohol phosphatidyltransferase family protein [Calditerrivibrio nitroreducens]ADR19023.1 CDP-alcohol phosphatidyltransferase [Calditerrivibrio nitroreducens DSM 19672]